jgi:Siphovirus protein of unknown function (DUF859)
MALSGVLTRNVGSGWQLRLEWSATQDKANNRSTITTNLYWVSLGSSYTISSGSKSGYSEIGGTSESFSATATLSGNQKKLINTYSRTVSHNSEGRLTINLKGSFSVNVTLSGTYYGTQTVSGNVTLDNIPRESSITSSKNFTAPNAFPISISRASSSYTHTIRFYVDGTLIKTVTGIGTSVTLGWTESEMTSVFTKLAQRTSCPLQLQLDTYSGSTKIGSTKSYSGTVYAEDSSTNVNDANFVIGENVGISIARHHYTFTHKVIISVGGVVVHTSPVVEYGYTWEPTPAEITKAFDTVKTKNSTTSQIEMITYYNGVQVNKPTIQTGTARVINSDPIFTAGFVYEDINATTLALTNDKYSIIQKASIPKVTLPVASKATGQNSASIVSYTASLDGQTINAAYSDSGDVTFTFKPVSSGQDLTLSITAVDSRGNTTRASKTVTVIPYAPPSMSATARRNNGFEAATKLNLSGTMSPLTVGGENKNAILKADFRYRENISTTVFPSTWTSFTVSTNGLTYSVTEQSVDLVQNKQYVFQLRVTDKVGETIVERTVNKGIPIFFIDEVLNSVGVGAFPKNPNSLYVKGAIRTVNPTNELAEAYLDFKDNQARIRIGGTGDGALNGFQIHGTGDAKLFSVDNYQNADFYGKVRVSGTEVALKGQYEIPPTVPDLNAGFTAYYGTAYYKQLDGTVHFRGLLQGSTLGVTIFTLPASCRPSGTQIFYIPTRGGGQHRLDVNSDGTVKLDPTDGANYSQWWSLSGIKFPAGS